MKHLAKGKQGILVEDAEVKCSNLLSDFKEHLHNKYNRLDITPRVSSTNYTIREIINLKM
jgi:hypothetical protein